MFKNDVTWNWILNVVVIWGNIRAYENAWSYACHELGKSTPVVKIRVYSLNKLPRLYAWIFNRHNHLFRRPESATLEKKVPLNSIN